MNVQEAVMAALKFNQYELAGCITLLSNKIEAMRQKEIAYASVIETKNALLTAQQAEIEGLKALVEQCRGWREDEEV